MTLTKSKQFLADAIHASGKGWPDGANWACQHKRMKRVVFTESAIKPHALMGHNGWAVDGGCFFSGFKNDKLSPNWHQTCLSRDEYFSAYPVEPVADADGWIEWKGGKCPVEKGTLVDVKYRGDVVRIGMAALVPVNKCHGVTDPYWRKDGGKGDIIAYRLHKPEVKSTAVGDDETNLAAKEELEAMNYKPSIEQLMQTYADRAHSLQLANEHLDLCTKQASDAMKALSDACKDAGFDIFPITEKQEHELVITDWRYLQVGDEVEVPKSSNSSHVGCCGVVVLMAQCDDANQPIKVDFGELEIWVKDWRFIRRP